ncbi:hypothetical protein F7725_028285 [Dissostichus mawsoni]|uniref:Uncharacterized protein n=1 Tax=Dissostichus mawsoni TaxID=36200 RepID=A0A7J5XGI2_DISMA|nr:hypothetical protein F7725_028285 [Dissostichus mawsoni]
MATIENIAVFFSASAVRKHMLQEEPKGSRKHTQVSKGKQEVYHSCRTHAGAPEGRRCLSIRRCRVVNDTKIWHVEKTHLHVITAKALNSNPTSPWIVVQEDGTVVMAHCTCMAGLGERKPDMHREAMHWTQPSTKMVKYDEVSNIFAIKEQVETEDLFQHMRPSADDFKLFCEQLHQSEEQETKPKKSAILSVIEGHSHRYTPKTVQLDLPAPLTSLYQSSRLVLDLPALLEEGAKVFEELNLTPEQCLLVEEKTRKQSRSRVWFEQRAGRVTASSFHEAAKTESSSSLIKRVCYPRSSQFSTEATRWGLQNEDTAKKSYLAQMRVAEVMFCDFVVWTPQERIMFDGAFLMLHIQRW